jgi:Uma2 family endonuclease
MADLAVGYSKVKTGRELYVAEAPRSYLKELKWTYKDYKNWELKPGERIELIYGVVYAMSAPNTEHQRISMFLSGEFYNYLKGKTQN